MNKKQNENKECYLDIKYEEIKKLIKEGKLTFSYYKGRDGLELLSVINNKKDGLIEIKFRDVFNERMMEVKELLESKNIEK